MITIEHLDKIYQTPAGALQALRDISFSVDAQEIFGIIGRSGAGKSSLMRCLNGLEKPTSGRILLQKKSLTEQTATQLRALRQKIGVVFQQDCLVATKTVLDNVCLPLLFQGVDKTTRYARAKELLALVGLADKTNVYPRQLSGGQRQRVSIARALVSAPDVLLCDEPTSALDPETTRTMVQLLKNIRDSLGVTVICITHNMQVVKELCDRVAVLDEGQIVECKPVKTLFLHPESEAAKQWVNTVVHAQIPESIRNRLVPETQSAYPLWRLVFRDKTPSQAIIAKISREFSVSLNILQADLEYVNEEQMGFMLVEALGEFTALQQALDFLKTLSIQVEVAGHVRAAA